MLSYIQHPVYAYIHESLRTATIPTAMVIRNYNMMMVMMMIISGIDTSQTTDQLSSSAE